MADIGELTYELLKRVQADTADIKRELVSIRQRVSSVEQHQGTIAVDIARINSELDEIREDISLIKRRLDLVDA